MTEQPEINMIRVGAPDGRGGLYNMLDPHSLERADTLLPLVGLDPANGHLIRLRDAFLEKDGTGRVFVHIYTRIGGGNRTDYATIIKVLQAHPFYVRDIDDEEDTTYASFYFAIPPPLDDELRDAATEPIKPGQRLRDMVDRLTKENPR